MEDRPDLRGYWSILVKWWWVLLLFLVAGAVIAGALGYVNNRSRTPLYRSTAKLLIEGGQGSSVTTSGDSQTSQQLAQYYDELVRTRPFLSLMAQKLSVSPGEIADTISIGRPRTFIEITATHRDASQAAKIANVTAQSLVEDLRNRQLTQIAQIQASLSQYGIVQDPAITAAQVGRLSNLSIAEEALEPLAPFNKGSAMTRAAVLGGMLGLLVGIGAVFLREQLDDKVKSMDQLKLITGLVPLGAVMREPSQNALGPAIYADKDPSSPLAESYNFLRTSLEFATLGTKGMHTLLITSSSPGEGKTTTAANLATSFARSGKSVILIDGDLRRPSLHKLFKISNHKGLTDVLLGNSTLDEAFTATGVEGLRVVPAGPLPPDPTYVLRAPKMQEVVKQLRDRADLVIFDSPPLLVVSDPLLLARFADTVLLVVDAHSTTRDVLKRGVETLLRAKPELAGAVLNKMSHRAGQGYYYYQYSGYYTYGSRNGDRSHGKSQRTPWSRVLGKRKSKPKEQREVQPGVGTGA